MLQQDALKILAIADIIVLQDQPNRHKMVVVQVLILTKAIPAVHLAQMVIIHRLMRADVQLVQKKLSIV